MENSLKELAREALSYFETRERASGEKFISVKDDAPAWVSHMVRHAHDGMLPDDWRYSFVMDALSAIEHGDFDGVSLAPSWYTHQLASWLASNNYRIAYCDEAFGDGCNTTFSLLQSGQLLEMREVHSLVREYLEDRALDEHAATLGAFS